MFCAKEAMRARRGADKMITLARCQSGGYTLHARSVIEIIDTDYGHCHTRAMRYVAAMRYAPLYAAALRYFVILRILVALRRRHDVTFSGAAAAAAV